MSPDNALATISDDIPDDVLIALLVRRIEDRQNALDDLQSAFTDLERANNA